MFDRRIFAIVEGLLEDGVMKSVRPIASEVYEKAIVSRPSRWNFASSYRCLLVFCMGDGRFGISGTPPQIGGMNVLQESGTFLCSSSC